MAEDNSNVDSAPGRASSARIQERQMGSLAHSLLTPNHSRAEKAVSSSSLNRSRSTVGYWKQRLIHRPYPEARLSAGPEYSVRMEQEGLYNYFPLGSDREDLAAAKALEIHRVILRQGWQAAAEQFDREVTLAIFWADNPAAVT